MSATISFGCPACPGYFVALPADWSAEPDHYFCPKCGALLRRIGPSEAAPDTAAPAQGVSPTPRARPRSRKWVARLTLLPIALWDVADLTPEAREGRKRRVLRALLVAAALLVLLLALAALTALLNRYGPRRWQESRGSQKGLVGTACVLGAALLAAIGCFTWDATGAR